MEYDVKELSVEEKIGQMLNTLGVNMDLAPVLNIKRFPDEHAIGDRAYGVLVGHLKIMNMLGKVPASLSKKFITKYIRKKERYDGLVITDDVRMKSIKMRYGSNRVIKKAFLACNDIIVFKYDNDIQVIKDIIKMAKDNIIEMKKVNKSVTRILRVKEKYQLNDEEIKKDDEFVDKINKEIEEIRQKVL